MVHARYISLCLLCIDFHLVSVLFQFVLPLPLLLGSCSVSIHVLPALVRILGLILIVADYYVVTAIGLVDIAG